MNFFAALSIFHIITPGVDVGPLPLLSTTFQIDAANVILATEQEVWQVKATGLLENLVLKPNAGRTKVDTTFSYISLNSANNPIQFTSLPAENPIQNGTEFLYTGNLLNQRLQYEKGKKVFTTEYQYASGLLERRVTVDSIGPVDTTLFTYNNGNIIAIESRLRSGFLKTKYTYRGTDTIESREYDVNDLASPVRILWILKDGNIHKQFSYTSGKLTSYMVFEHPTVTDIKRLRSNGIFPIGKKTGQRDALGRHLNYLEGAGSLVLPGRK
jgi:hypothetical protein